mmetsp:Transcript_4021/g.5630  ORF Transcript_4021/g.5630 Transcript_4021/m.5630 type:complete len:140 (-) Transcript_4021:59-478(-)
MIGNTIQRYSTHAVGACEGESEGEAVGAFKGEALVAFEKMEALSIGSLVVQLRRAQIEDWRWWRSKRTPPTRARNLRYSLQSRPGIQLSLFLIFTTKINNSFSMSSEVWKFPSAAAMLTSIIVLGECSCLASYALLQLK